MSGLIRTIGKLFGIYFAPDNHVVPVLRLGRYHRVRGPGFVFTIPLLERTLPPVKTSIYVGAFHFTEILSRDNIPFTFDLTVLFTFKPDAEETLEAAAAQLVRSGEAVLQTIVRDYSSQGLRRLVAKYEATTLSEGQILSSIEGELSRYLTTTMRVLGLAPLKNDGVLIKEIVAPETFKRTMLDVKHDESILEVLRSYPVPELVQLLNQVILANSLKDRDGHLSLLIGAPEAMQMIPLLEQQHSYSQNGYHR